MQVTELDREELFHTVPGYEADGLFVSGQSGFESTYTSYARANLPPMIQDVYGKWIPRMPNGPTLDGMPVEEWAFRNKFAKAIAYAQTETDKKFGVGWEERAGK